MTFPTLFFLSYFLQAYWNQTSDHFYDDIAGAAADYLSESEDYRIGLIGDLRAAERLGLFGESYEDQLYQSSFWAPFTRLVSKAEAATLLSRIEAG